MSYSYFQTNVSAKFVDIISIFSTFSLLILCLIALSSEYKLIALHVRLSKQNTPNATIQQFITAKISGCTLK